MVAPRLPTSYPRTRQYAPTPPGGERDPIMSLMSRTDTTRGRAAILLTARHRPSSRRNARTVAALLAVLLGGCTASSSGTVPRPVAASATAPTSPHPASTAPALPPTPAGERVATHLETGRQ